MAVLWCYTVAPRSPPSKKIAHGFRCCSSSSMNRRKAVKLQTQTPKLLKFAVSGVTQLLRLLSPSDKDRLDELNGEGGNIELSVSDVDDVLMIIKADYEREYFVTGLFTSEIYAEDCTFEDPTIKFRGRLIYTWLWAVITLGGMLHNAPSNRLVFESHFPILHQMYQTKFPLGRDLYSSNLKLLVPFFDNPSIKLEKIEKGANSNADFIMATWKLRTYLKLPWKPLISVNGRTVYDLDRQLRVVKHVESWNISALEAIGQIFTPGFQMSDEF